MGVMMDGHWEIDDGRWAAKDGQFHRAESTFHCPFSDGGFTAEKNRYRLYVSLA